MNTVKSEPIKVTKNYTQKFREEWLQDPKFRNWLRRVEGNERNCFCKCCEVILTTKRSSIEKHGNTIKHKNVEEMLGIPSPEDIALPIIIKTESKTKSGDDVQQFYENNPEYQEGEMPDVSGHVETVGIEYSSTDDSYIQMKPDDGNYLQPSDKPLKISTSMKKRKKTEANLKKALAKPTNLNIEKGDSELDIFGKSIVAQMKMLPEKYAIGLTFEIQNLVTEKRLKALEEKNVPKQQRMDNHQVITVSLGNGQSYQTVQSSPAIYTSYQ